MENQQLATIQREQLATMPSSVIEAIKPYQADDGHKGTFLVLRIAGLDQGMALKIVNRKYRSWQNWRLLDPEFNRIEAQIPELNQKFGGEARVLRTALLDISVIETGISIFKKILQKEQVSSDMWTYATRLAGLRVPMMGAKEESGSPWQRLANAITNTQREMTVTEIAPDGSEKSITAKEVTKIAVVQPSPEQRKMAQDIVGQILARQAGEQSLEGQD